MKRAIVIFTLLAAVACSRDARVVPLDGQWQYASGTAKPSVWADEPQRDAARPLWLRHPLPQPLANDARIVFRTYTDAVEVFVDDTRVYSFDDASSRDRITVHDVPIPAGQWLSFRIPHPGAGLIFGGAPSIATTRTAPFALVDAVADPLREDLSDIVTGLALLVIGVIALVVSRLPRRVDPSALLWFGVFAALYGVRLVADTSLPLILGVSTTAAAYVVAVITYTITVPGWLLASALVGRGWHSTLRWQVIAFAAFAPIGIGVDVIRHMPRSLDWVNNILVIVGGINILANLVVARHWRTPELRVILAGATLFMLLALNNNLAALGVLPWSEGDETLGFLVFVGVLGWGATRSFMRGERARLAMEGELAAAREIQRSILPAEMPRIAGLRVSARYDPASSVAGDLYDFLPVDDHRLGIVVADVSGHGVPAALIASMVKIGVTSNGASAHDPGAMLTHLSRTLRRDVRRTFVTATYLWIDTERGVVSVANAGHPAPLLFRDGTFTELGTTGVVLGRFGVATYAAATSELRAGDRIVAWTDGITEARNARGEQFGEERMKDIIRTSSNVAEDLLAAVHRWRRVDEDADDLTIVAVDL